MNKINDRTYLYNIHDKYITKLGLLDFVLIYNPKNSNNIWSKKIMYILEVSSAENTNIYNKLFKQNWNSISVGDFSKKKINNNEYINILNVENKCTIYARFDPNINEENIQYIISYISIMIADDIVVNKVSDIKRGFEVVDIALDFGKEIYCIPGEIFNAKSYLSNYILKCGATPICGVSDVKYLLLQKDYKRV